MAKAKKTAKSAKTTKRAPAKKSYALFESKPIESHSYVIQFAVLFIIVAALFFAYYLGKTMGVTQ
jgi:hypothetical protein